MYKTNVRLLKIFNFLIGFSLFAPLAIIYFSRVSGSYTLGASIFGITMLASAIFEVPTGIWSDRVGRRGTIILGSWARVLAFILYAIGLSYWWLVAGAILEGLSRAFYSGNNDAFLHDTLADDGLEGEYDEHLGKTSSTEHTAIGISGLLGGVIASFSFSYIMWLSVVAQIFMLFISYRFIEPKSRTKLDTNLLSHLKQAVVLFVHNKKLRLLAITDAISFSTGEVSFQFRSAFLQSVWPLWAIGLVHVFTSIGASISYYLSGKLIKKFGSEKILLIRSIYGKISGLIAYGIPSVYSPLIVITPSVLYGAGQVAKNQLMQKEFTDHQRATMSSLNSLVSSIGFAIMSLAIGLFADFTSPAKALFTMTLIAVPIIYLYYLLFKNDRKIKV
ncbi:hypothetical protein COT87_02850 [Candidatus Collierbacteria bacterium CG10_big_fil_rev_8_21_14_0_10_44_9]|uniref:Major facilitator superfamily (MFS) profile domain-containing protein n=1 Tax=Candidatus Collierbacteria bacterium CG10_big_fil_rev_8_21_14_0_10_44_9 TaxID=1974535 RepID=A0A2H0VI98_9BACT|nr:MAG: hypothetical protein COT87_02850 [Candidatus Collierbacteria bacterium CG10_big_fil_rev_8_21_14_0_10_44_9]